MANQLLESLENRRLFSTYTPDHVTSTGTLMIQGTPGNDNIDIVLVRGSKQDSLAITIQIPASGGSRFITLQTQVRFNTVKRILIDAGAGDDKITLSGPMASIPATTPGGDPTFLPIPATVLGGAGDDSIMHDALGPLFASGGAGNDFISAESSAIIPVSSSKNSQVLDDAFADAITSLTPATIMGGAGDDRIAADFNDQVDGGAGNDTGNVEFTSNNPTPTNDRFIALAHDFYQRIGATSLEQFENPNTVIIGSTDRIFSVWNTPTQPSSSKTFALVDYNNDPIEAGEVSLSPYHGIVTLAPTTGILNT